MRLVLLSALALAIAFLIPVFASLPTYNDLGGIFVRTASLYLNLNLFNSAIIIVALLFSLLFLSFAIVVMNVVVKSDRTHTRVKTEVLRALEQYTGMVFVVLLLYTIVILAANALAYRTGYSAIATIIAALLLAPLVFYAPSSIIIDERGISNAMRASVGFFLKRFDYFVIWLAVSILMLTILDLVAVGVGGALLSGYLMLVLSSVFVLPFLLLLQGQLYISRFKLLG
jgi:hypothetical protein